MVNDISVFERRLNGKVGETSFYRETAGYWPILPEELKTSVRLVNLVNL